MIKTAVEIKKELVAIIAQVLEQPLAVDELPTGPGLLDHLQIDSLLSLQIIVRIEQRFMVAIDDDDVAVAILDSLDSAVAFLQKESALAAANP